MLFLIVFRWIKLWLCQVKTSWYVWLPQVNNLFIYFGWQPFFHHMQQHNHLYHACSDTPHNSNFVLYHKNFLRGDFVRVDFLILLRWFGDDETPSIRFYNYERSLLIRHKIFVPTITDSLAHCTNSRLFWFFLLGFFSLLYTGQMLLYVRYFSLSNDNLNKTTDH